jgi:hypothetical protein
LRLEDSRKVVAPLCQLVIQGLDKPLDVSFTFGLQMVPAVLECIYLSEYAAANFVEFDQGYRTSHQGWLPLSHRRTREVFWKVFIINFNRKFDVAVGVIDTQWPTQSEGEHAVQSVHTPPDLSPSFLFHGGD